MARIRTVKPAFFSDEKLGQCKRDSRLLFIGLWVHGDDYGTVRSNPAWIKANVFPYDNDISTENIKEWAAELSDKKMIIPFEYKKENFYHIRTFYKHQRVDKKSEPIIPIDILNVIIQKLKSTGALDEDSEPELVSSSSNSNSKGKDDTAKAVSNAPALLFDDEGSYKKIEKNKKSICEFIREKRPSFADPYKDLWNLFAEEKKLPKITKLSPSRSRHLRVRVREEAFNFLEILRKAGTSEFLLTSGWFGWDWIMKGSDNYLKVIEGNYDKNPAKKIEKKQEIKPILSERQEWDQTLKYLLGREAEGQLDERVILPEYFTRLTLDNELSVKSLNGMEPGEELNKKKVQLVIEYLKKKAVKA